MQAITSFQMPSMYVVKRCLSKALVISLSLTMLQVITGSFSLSLSSAYTQGTATNGTSYGGTGGSPNGANQNCSSGAIVAIGASKSGNNLNSFMFVCKTVNNDASLSATEATTNVFNAPSESDRCSVGQIGVGVRVIASNGGTLVGGVGLICGNPVSGGSQNTRSIMPDALSAGTVYTYTCGTGQLLAGFYLRTGALVDQLTPKCSTFSGFAYAAVGAPTATVTGNTASVSFTPVTGSTADTSLTYTVSAVPSSGSTITVTGNASPISVPDLVLRANYTVTVTASNAYGSSPSTSSASATMALPGSDTDTALSLNGSTQYADVSDTTGSPFDITGTLTLEAWVNPASSCSGSGTVISKRSYMLYCQAGVWMVMFLANGVSGSGITTNISVRANEWQHIAVTKSSGSGSALFYYNGVLASTIATGVTTMTPNDSSFEIGRHSAIAGYYFQGKIDEVRVYNSQRTVTEIKSDMNSYATVGDANLVAYYDLNEASGSTIYNQKTGASSSTDLTISGSATYGDVKSVDTSVAAYTIVKFPRTYITAIGGWKAPQTARSSILTVAGGGGGGARHGGGGGGGGVSYAPTYMLSSGATYEIKVGTGGFGYPAGAGTGTSGVNSTFKPSNILESITALGGGGGGGTGLSGGSSGGTSSGLTYSTVPEKTQYSTSYFVGYGNKGGQGYDGSSCGTDWCGGGGGGAGSPGGIPTNTQAGNGGNGFAVAIESLTVTYYGGGGGGGSYNPTLNSTGGLGGGGAGGKNAQGANGTFALGGGGGGGGFAGGTSYGGGNGGSGVIIVRWITATAPIFTGPKFDTLTAGLTETFTVSGSATSPLTRNFRWQVSTDTGTSWSNATGSGFLTANYLTPTLETTTSGIRYQYRVVVTDSDTAGLFIVDTSTAVYLMINPRNTITSSTGSATFTQKYGESRTAVFTFAFGTGPRTPTVASTTNNQNGKITWSNLNSDSATVRIGTNLSVGSYSETITVTDSVTAFTTQALTITVSKADTITVTTTLSTSTVTYTESPAAITATPTVTGLVNSETATVTSTYTANSCEYGGTCVIGDVAPGGGYVFYVSATTINVATGISTGGIYLATAPQTWSGGTIDPNASWGCEGASISGTVETVGFGAENTRLINAGCATAGIASRLAADSSAEGFTDWFIPSMSELELIYYNLKVNSLSNLQSWNYWSSTQRTTNPAGNALIWWFGSGAGAGFTAKNNSAASNMYVRPIRAFSPTALASATVPTDAGVYKVGSTFAISSPASLSNYQGVESVTATLTINKANQRTITIGQYLAYPNISSYPLNVYGGSGPGTLTRTLVSAGSAGCSLASSFILTATSVGSCTVKAEKAGTRNYIVESTTATIYWIAWLDNYAAQTLGGNNVIPLAGGNQIIVRTETLTASAFSNTSGGAITSAAVGTTIRINSTGFSGLNVSDVSVTFRPYEDAVVSAVTSTYVEVVIPSGAVTGVIAIDSPRGVAYTQSFTISP